MKKEAKTILSYLNLYAFAGEVLGDKTNNKPSPETNSNTKEQLPVKIKDTRPLYLDEFMHKLHGWLHNGYSNKILKTETHTKDRLISKHDKTFTNLTTN